MTTERGWKFGDVIQSTDGSKLMVVADGWTIIGGLHPNSKSFLCMALSVSSYRTGYLSSWGMGTWQKVNTDDEE